MRKPKLTVGRTPEERIASLQTQEAFKDKLLDEANRQCRRLLDEVETLRPLVKAQAAALILFEERRGDLEIPF